MSKNKEVLSKEQKSKVREYIGSRLGTYGVRSYELEYSEPEGMTYQALFKGVVPLKGAGIFSKGLKKVELEARVWKKEKNKYARVDLSLSYETKGSGHNGIDLDIVFKVLSDGEIVESYDNMVR